MRSLKLMIIPLLALGVVYFFTGSRTQKKPSSEGEFQYFLWKVDVLSASEHVGESFEFAQIAATKFKVDEASRIELADEIQMKGSEEFFPNPIRAGQGESPAGFEDLQQPVGFSKEIERSAVSFYRLFQQPSASFLTLAPANGERQVRYQLSLLKRCPVQVELTERHHLASGKTNGVVTLPSVGTRQVALISRPSCLVSN